jgi:hypothetical protein
MGDDEIKQRIGSVVDLVRDLAVEGEERHNRQMEEIRREVKHLTEQILRVDRQSERTERTLRRAIHLAVQEARAERRRRQESDDRLDSAITKLAAAQLETEQKWREWIDSMKRGPNGHPS